ncbi:MAG: DUF1015 domain-containing protein [Actinomycetota bacterium]|nr:DUF1015 domain-containing protein [Actinomycetota bacterium]
MAEVLPFPALHYDLRSIGSLGAVTAPPYDVIDPAGRAALLARSPFNVVELDLPQPTGPGSDRYENAAEILEEWILNGILTQDRTPTMWALTQEFDRPDGGRQTRNAILARVRVTDYGPGRIRPHERTQPGAKQDRLELTRATRYNLSPIFSLTSRDAWPAVAPVTSSGPWGEVTDEEGTTHRLWPVTDPEVHAAVTAELAEAELLIADGHHRYETARAYMSEIGGDGPHCFTLMALTGLDDPGLTVFPTHRLLTGIGNPDLHDRLERGLADSFEMEEVFPADASSAELAADPGLDGIDPADLDGIGCFGYADGITGRRFRMTLRDTGRLPQLFPDSSDGFRTLDAAILERIVFRDVLGMSPEDVEAKRGLAYAHTVDEATNALATEEAQAAFLLRATPIDQVRSVAAAGETMPPKSTFFFPKLLSGMAFNPLS